MEKTLAEYIDDSEQIIIGIGNEWDWIKKGIRTDVRYNKLFSLAALEGNEWLLPIIEFEYGYYNNDKRIDEGYRGLKKLVGDKRYFLVSDIFLQDALLNGFDMSRCVYPCGNYMYLQTAAGDDELINAAKCSKFQELVDLIHDIVTNRNGDIAEDTAFNKPVFNGKELYLNQKRTEYSNIKYNESAYLENWDKYMKYLSGTVGSKLLILELGVSLDYPTVIRWPFEKVTLINRKAHLIRVHHKLYHHTPEIGDRTDSIRMDSVDYIEEESENL